MNNKTLYQNIIPGVDKTLQLVNAIAESPDGLRQDELMEQLEISASTCYRILQTLLKYSWIEKRSGSRYELAMGTLPILLKLHKMSNGWEYIQEILDDLSFATGLSSKLSIRQGLEQLTVARGEAPGPFAVVGKIGCRFPVCEGSVGAVLLSCENPGKLKKILQACDNQELLEKQHPDLFYRQIEQVKQKGYALNLKQNRWNVCAMSSPIFNNDNSVAAALTVLGMPQDFSEERLAFLQDVLCKTCKRQGQYNPYFSKQSSRKH